MDIAKLERIFQSILYVALYDGVISEDTADWRYVGKKGGGRDIAIAEYYHSALDFDAMKMHLEDLKWRNRRGAKERLAWER